MPSINPKPKVTADLSGNGETVLVTFDYHPDHVKDVKRVPSARFVGKDKPEGPAWRFNLDLPTMRSLRDKFGDLLTLGPKLKEWGAQQVAKEQALTDLSQADDADLDNVPARMIKGCAGPDGKRFKLRPYQKADAKFMATTNVINANQPRTGKTITTIAALFECEMEWGQHLIFAPKASLRNVWQDGIKHAYKCAGYDEPTVLTGSTPEERRQAIQEAKELAEGGYAFWLVLNPYSARMERIRTLDGKEVSKDQIKAMKPRDQERVENDERLVAPELAEVQWDSITIDEFHLMGLSNPTTLGARGVMEIAEITQPAKRYALSGTPMGGKPIKLWGALRFLNPDEFTSRWNWARHWLVINSSQYGSKIEGIMPGREDAFYNHLKPYLVRRTQREALPGLPPRQVVNVWCDMTPNQLDQYTTMATQAEWILEDAEQEGRMSVTNTLSMYTRLKQFADGYCDVSPTFDIGGESTGFKVAQTQDSGKLEQLLEKLAEENVLAGGEDDEDPKCALVFSQFNPMVKMVAEALNERGCPTVVIGAMGLKGRKADEAIAVFQAQSEGAARVLVMNTAAGTALTLDRAETVHLLDETWVPDNQEQAENRITPTTKERMERANIGIYYYRTRGTVEEYVRQLVADKALNNKTILDLRRRMQKALKEAEKSK